MKKLDFKKLTKKQREVCLHLIYELTFVKAKDVDNQLKDYLLLATDPVACQESLEFLKDEMLKTLDQADRFFNIKEALNDRVYRL